jgi:hypothetical protein
VIKTGDFSRVSGRELVRREPCVTPSRHRSVTYNAMGEDPDFEELHSAFFTPETNEDWERSSRGPTVVEAINIVVPPARLPW